MGHCITTTQKGLSPISDLAQVIYSTVSPAYLSEILIRDYSLLAPQVKLIRRGFNDVYLVEDDQQKYILRVYLQNKYWLSGLEDILFEIDMLDHLQGKGVSVSYSLPRGDGSKLGILKAPEGDRAYALFSYAQGQPSEMTSELLHSLGQAIARLHLASNSFVSPNSRYKLDLDSLVHHPLARMKPFFIDRPTDWHYLNSFGSSIAEALEQAELPSEAWGYIHGDIHSGNIHYHDGNFTFFDFDHSGFGWRAYDLAPILWGAESNQHSSAFIEGYTSLAPLSPQEKNLLPTLVKARALWDNGDMFAMIEQWGLVLTSPRRLDGIIKQLKELEQKMNGLSFE